MLEKSITLNGWKLDLMSPNKVYSFTLTLILPWIKYSPTTTIRQNYLECFEVGVQYSKWILKEKEAYVGKRGWNMAKSFIIKAKKKGRVIQEADRNKLVTLIFNDIFVDEGLIIRDTAIHRVPFVLPRNEPIAALSKTTYESKYVRRRLTFNEKWESMKIRKRLVFGIEARRQEWEERMEKFFSGENNSMEELENAEEESSKET